METLGFGESDPRGTRVLEYPHPRLAEHPGGGWHNQGANREQGGGVQISIRISGLHLGVTGGVGS